MRERERAERERVCVRVRGVLFLFPLCFSSSSSATSTSFFRPKTSLLVILLSPVEDKSFFFPFFFPTTCKRGPSLTLQVGATGEKKGKETGEKRGEKTRALQLWQRFSFWPSKIKIV